MADRSRADGPVPGVTAGRCAQKEPPAAARTAGSGAAEASGVFTPANGLTPAEPGGGEVDPSPAGSERPGSAEGSRDSERTLPLAAAGAAGGSTVAIGSVEMTMP